MSAKSEIRTVETANAPLPAGHYSQAVVFGGTIYVSGQLPFNPLDPPDPTPGLADQAARCLDNIEAILRAAGSGLDRVLKVTIFVTDIAAWPTVNEVYARKFGDHRPARIVVPCGTMHGGAEIEIDAVAAT